MAELTHNNFLQHSPVFYNKCERAPSSVSNEADRACKLIAEKSGDIVLCLSGGIDSEIMVRLFMKNRIKFDVAIMRFNNDLNNEDIQHGLSFCKEQNIKPHIVDLDVIDFYDSGKYLDYCYMTKCSSPQFATYMWLLDQLHGSFPVMADIIPIVGGNKKAINVLINNELSNNYNVYYVEKMQRNMVLLDHKEAKEPVYSLPNDCKLSLLRFMQASNMSGAPLFFRYTPELIYAMLIHKATKEFLEKKSWNYKNKLWLYKQFFDFPTTGRFASTDTPIKGFEQVKKHYCDLYPNKKLVYDGLFRHPLIEKYPHSMDRLLINIQNLREHLHES